MGLCQSQKGTWTSQATRPVGRSFLADSYDALPSESPSKQGLWDNWSHLFPATAETDRIKLDRLFEDFQEELRTFSADCDAYNADARERSFPYDFGLWSFNPK